MKCIEDPVICFLNSLIKYLGGDRVSGKTLRRLEEYIEDVKSDWRKHEQRKQLHDAITRHGDKLVEALPLVARIYSILLENEWGEINKDKKYNLRHIELDESTKYIMVRGRLLYREDRGDIHVPGASQYYTPWARIHRSSSTGADAVYRFDKHIETPKSFYVPADDEEFSGKGLVVEGPLYVDVDGPLYVDVGVSHRLVYLEAKGTGLLDVEDIDAKAMFLHAFYIRNTRARTGFMYMRSIISGPASIEVEPLSFNEITRRPSDLIRDESGYYWQMFQWTNYMGYLIREELWDMGLPSQLLYIPDYMNERELDKLQRAAAKYFLEYIRKRGLGISYINIRTLYTGGIKVRVPRSHSLIINWECLEGQRLRLYGEDYGCNEVGRKHFNTAAKARPEAVTVLYISYYKAREEPGIIIEEPGSQGGGHGQS